MHLECSESTLGESLPSPGALPDLDELLNSNGEALQRSCVASHVDIPHVIDEVRVELGTLASREALQGMGLDKRRQMAETAKGHGKWRLVKSIHWLP